MPVSKKIRFEVFKRDGFKCGYCGKHPPEVTLEADHIEPKSTGGKDDISNLITACFDCNRGKKHIPLEKISPKIQENLEVLIEQEEQIKAYRHFIKRIEKRINTDIGEINSIYSNQYPKWEFSEHFKNTTLKRFLKLLPKHEIIEALCLAISKYPKDSETVIPYFCGICWRKIKGENPSTKIKQKWKELSKYYNRGIGYCRDADIETIKNIPFEKLTSAMIKVFGERHDSYWNKFMEEVRTLPCQE